MILLLRGLMPLVSGTKPGAKAGSVLPAFGYKTFVAWRYLMVNPPRVGRVVYALIGAGIGAAVLLGVTIWLVGVPGDDLKHPLVIAQWLASMFAYGVIWVGMMRFSRPARWVFVIGYIAMILCLVAMDRIIKDKLPFIDLELEDKTPILQGIAIAMMISAVVAFISLVAGMLRSVFTFFTTVPIVGVWIGTCALVIVLSVMSGFESDLRQKILGSNAHIQVTREDGDFTEWRDIKKRLDKLPGIVASTPFAVSEVVIAANNNGMPVIIKGIDPATVGNVTDLVSDLEDRDAIKRLDPLVDDTYDRRIPQTPHKPTGKVVDPPPSDMPNGGDPIDFSHPSTPPPDLEPPAPPPDDARNVVDPPPPDLLSSDEPPTDYSASGSDLPIHVADTIDSSISRRTQALPGVLVGRELVKQTHLYTGEEVRVVSPLSDSANPDATGTPIPFNRDYRVAGVFYTGMYEYDLKFVYVSLESLQVFLDRGDAVDGIEVRVTDPDDSEHFVDMIGSELGPAYRVQDWNTLNRSLFSALKLEKIAMFAVLGIVILVASFSIVG
ncbi:MAG TPA: ABC transporter permease, partial [Kofleriaceae bacterium]|nr:ABC transporter permease [Kofleriaceae bacterium]